MNLEVVAVEVWSSAGSFTVVDHYIAKPCLQLEMEKNGWDDGAVVRPSSVDKRLQCV